MYINLIQKEQSKDVVERERERVYIVLEAAYDLEAEAVEITVVLKLLYNLFLAYLPPRSHRHSFPSSFDF